MKNRNSVYNLIANLSLQIVTSLIGLILPKLFIEAYGSSINGMVSSINQFLRYLALVEVGLGAATILSLYGPLAEKNTKKINIVLSASRKFYIKTGCFFSVLVLVLAFIYPFFVREEVGYLTSSVLILILSGSGLIEYFIVGKYRVLLIADQKSYVISTIQTMGILINAIVMIILIKSGFNIIIAQSASILVFTSRAYFISRYIKYHYPELKFNKKPTNLNVISRRGDAFIQQIATSIIATSPIIILTFFCKLSEVSVYVIYGMVFASVNMLLSAFSSGLLAGFGQTIAKGENEQLRKRFDNYEFLYQAILTWAYICVVILILPFIDIYTYNISDVNYSRPILAALFVVAGFINNIKVPHYTMITAAGHYRETRNHSIFEVIIYLVFSVVFIQYFGINGIVIGLIVSSLFRTPQIIYYSSRNILKNKSSWKTLFRFIQSIILVTVACLPFLFLNLEVNSFKQWLIYSILVGTEAFIVVVLGNIIFEYKNFKKSLSIILELLTNLRNKRKKV